MVIPFLLILGLGLPIEVAQLSAAPKSGLVLIEREFQVILRDGQRRPLQGAFEIEVVEAGFGPWAEPMRPRIVGRADSTGLIKAKARLPFDPDVLERAAKIARSQGRR